MQHCDQLLMIRPVNFGFNTETAVNNAFQKNKGDVQQKALREFDAFVDVLRKNKVDVLVIDDTPDPFTPDSIFPNNWISFHEDGTIYLYPMFAPNRRMERKPGVLDAIRKQFMITEIIDLSSYEADNIFLEGTGSMVLDRENKIAYACLSPRTNEQLLLKFCKLAGYQAITFRATDSKGDDIYHTNVMMCMGDAFAVICLDSITDENEKREVIESLSHWRKEIIGISQEQLDHFAGNMLQVRNKNDVWLLVMSSQAYHSLHPDQLHALEKYSRIIHSPLDSIETAGGGSARCMMAEIFLEKSGTPDETTNTG